MTPVDAIPLTCAECGDAFAYTEPEQRFRAEHGMAPPMRCPDCRASRRAERNADLAADTRTSLFAAPEPTPGRSTPRGGGHRTGHGQSRGPSHGHGRGHNPAERFPAICAACGQPTRVPFVPRGDRPVYCRACFNARRGR